MKTLIAFGLLSLAASPTFAQDCTYPERQPVQREGETQYRFTDSCGKPYEVGYRLEGKPLHFPRGGQHTCRRAAKPTPRNPAQNLWSCRGMGRLDPHQGATNTRLTKRTGWSARGSRFAAYAPFGHWKTQTFIAGLRCHGLTAPWIVDAPMNSRIFETWIETQLAPTLSKGDVVILDNVGFHKSERAE